MKKINLTLITLLFYGMAWGQSTPPLLSDEKINVTTNDGTPKESPSDTEKTKEEDLKKLIQKILNDNTDSNTAIGSVILKIKTIVYDKELASKIEEKDKFKSNEVKNIFQNLYLKLIRKEEIDKKNYQLLTIKVKSDSDNMGYDAPIIKIDSAKFDIQEGMLEFIKVYLSDGTTYTNKAAPIALVHLEQRGNDRLFNADGDKFILLKNVVVFESNKRFGYLPDNKTFSLDNQDDKTPGTLILNKNSNINSLVNFTAYSDLLGLLGNEPNALVNFEANAKFYLHRLNYPNKFLYIFPTFQPHFHYNRIDSKFDTIVISDNNVNPTEIFRRHNFAVGFDLTVLRWDWKPANSFELKAGYLYTSSKVHIDEKKTNAINHIKYFEANLKSKVIDNFGIDLNAKYMWQKLNDNEYFDSSKEEMLALRGGIYYASPKAKGDDKIFLRFTNYLVWGDRKKDFSQIQIGFTKSLKF